MPTVKMSSIMLPQRYVREKINSKNLTDLLDVVKKANQKHLTKDGNFPKDMKKVVLEWPFNAPVLLTKNAKPDSLGTKEAQALKGEGVKATGKGKKKGKTFFPYEIIDGVHRYTLWRRLKQKEIEARIITVESPEDRFLEQYKTNASHGLRIDREGRDNFIRVAHKEFNVSLTKLAKESGLDRSSIVRILQTREHKKAVRQAQASTSPGKAAFNVPSIDMSDMSVTGFLERLQMLLNAYPKLAPQIDKYLTENSTSIGKSKLGGIASRLRAIANQVEASFKDSAPKTAPPKKPGNGVSDPAIEG